MAEKIRLRFESEDGRFAYLFPCDEAGNVLDGKFSAVDRLLLSWCRAGEIPSGHWQFCGPEVPGAVEEIDTDDEGREYRYWTRFVPDGAVAARMRAPEIVKDEIF